jgi:hypothetical protein
MLKKITDLIDYHLEKILIIICAVALIGLVYTFYVEFDKEDKYKIVCINGVEYIDEQFRPLVPSYKADGTINECEGDDINYVNIRLMLTKLKKD